MHPIDFNQFLQELPADISNFFLLTKNTRYHEPTPAEILAWILNRRDVKLGKNQLVQAWRFIAAELRSADVSTSSREIRLDVASCLERL
ncbi:MAG: hypothetical protein QG614_624 [Patescibacteria group bacterium]|nr:hypothetical protein [Patescibacteria group bacterium]